ncbi:hypothetical protein B0H13DRAFT_2438884 [Mycena leptocephala]|nr:hypothetical protein B0H13DRAFT_2438884 [Mycena leptocephala]
MKTVFLASVISLLPVAKALVGSGWTVTNVPSTGLSDITFPITIVEADHISGYFFAQQYQFMNSDSYIGYTGLQPRPNQNGKPVLHGVQNCAAGADGGPGVSCSVEWNGVYGRTYDLEVKRNGSSLWVGTAVDTLTGARTHIGSYTVPAGAGGIGGPRRDSSNGTHGTMASRRIIAPLPYQKTRFGHPRTTHPGSVGTQSLSYEYGDCVGKVAFHTQKVRTVA